MKPPARTNYDRLVRFLLKIAVVLFGLAALANAALLFGIGDVLDANPARLAELSIALAINGVAAAGAWAGLIVFSRRSVTEKTARVILLAFTAGLLVSVDRVFAVAVPRENDNGSIYERHPTRGWRHRPHSSGVLDAPDSKINSLGLREPEFPPAKPEGEFRVLLVGDSVVFGYLTAYLDTLAPQTEQALTRRGAARNVRLINSGVCGYATWQELDYLKNEGVSLNPDLIVLGFCYNDVTDLVGIEQENVSGILPAFAPGRSAWLWSGIVRAAESWQLRRASATSAWAGRTRINRVNPVELYTKRDQPDIRKAWDRALRDLTRFKEYCASINKPLLLCVFPLRSQFVQGGEDLHVDRTVTQWAKQNAVDVLDLREAFSADPSPTRLYSHLDQFHLTPAGYHVAANALADRLLKGKYLPASGQADRTGSASATGR
jgi:lysophospholipase L1-like esterase